jgi:class 3 adenylate cyclase
MAVWGTPTATEDDAERAVRAALDLVAAVTRSATRSACRSCAPRRRPDRRGGGDARRRGRGMVAGDLVNTASRIQSLPSRAPCSSARRHAARPSRPVVYEDAGSHELKG